MRAGIRRGSLVRLLVPEAAVLVVSEVVPRWPDMPPLADPELSIGLPAI
jgi:hypothetical protein